MDQTFGPPPRQRHSEVATRKSKAASHRQGRFAAADSRNDRGWLLDSASSDPASCCSVAAGARGKSGAPSTWGRRAAAPDPMPLPSSRRAGAPVDRNFAQHQLELRVDELETRLQWSEVQLERLALDFTDVTALRAEVQELVKRKGGSRISTIAVKCRSGSAGGGMNVHGGAAAPPRKREDSSAKRSAKLRHSLQAAASSLAASAPGVTAALANLVANATEGPTQGGLGQGQRSGGECNRPNALSALADTQAPQFASSAPQSASPSVTASITAESLGTPCTPTDGMQATFGPTPAGQVLLASEAPVAAPSQDVPVLTPSPALIGSGVSVDTQQALADTQQGPRLGAPPPQSIQGSSLTALPQPAALAVPVAYTPLVVAESPAPTVEAVSAQSPTAAEAAPTTKQACAASNHHCHPKDLQLVADSAPHMQAAPPISVPTDAEGSVAAVESLQPCAPPIAPSSRTLSSASPAMSQPPVVGGDSIPSQTTSKPGSGAAASGEPSAPALTSEAAVAVSTADVPGLSEEHAPRSKITPVISEAASPQLATASAHTVEVCLDSVVSSFGAAPVSASSEVAAASAKAEVDRLRAMLHRWDGTPRDADSEGQVGGDRIIEAIFAEVDADGDASSGRTTRFAVSCWRASRATVWPCRTCQTRRGTSCIAMQTSIPRDL